ncbi:Pro-rich N-terminal domain-containing protein [Streptomyces sp. NPDC001231]|uniref:Pro-rich N-terminal domain-containing protein n=1 Tax=Streptomyces sp. NPDC001231 TaxID=3364549 RepID=UPI00369E4BD6
MQHAVGSPLPPPRQPGHGPAAGWAPDAHHPGPRHPGSAPVPPPPPASGYPGAPAPQPPGPHPSAPHHQGPPPPAPRPQSPHPQGPSPSAPHPQGRPPSAPHPQGPPRSVPHPQNPQPQGPPPSVPHPQNPQPQGPPPSAPHPQGSPRSVPRPQGPPPSAPHPQNPQPQRPHPQSPHQSVPAVPPPGVPPAPDATGHVRLPPGGPVGMPSVPPAQTAPDPTTTTLAVLLIGPAGAGKTSVAKYWADHRRVPTAHISLDDVREWVRSGFADPQSGWNDHSEAQYRLARRTCGFAARNFLANGISCILDDAVFPDRPVVGLGGWKRHVGPGLLPVVLLPGLDIVLERNAERSGNRRLTDEEVARIHGRMAGWYGSGLPIIDNSQLDVPATARVLDEVLSRAIASPPNW